MHTFQVQTSKRNECIDITPQVLDIVEKSSVTEGLCHVFCPHTTAGIMINENADPTVKSDFVKKLEKDIPQHEGYDHMEGNSDSHVKTAIVGESRTIIIHQRKLVLGTWQGIIFTEFDGPRKRSIVVKVMEG